MECATKHKSGKNGEEKDCYCDYWEWGLYVSGVNITFTSRSTEKALMSGRKKKLSISYENSS